MGGKNHIQQVSAWHTMLDGSKAGKRTDFDTKTCKRFDSKKDKTHNSAYLSPS
jgi:hypothetical protein